MFESLPVQLWMLLPLEERRILASDFDIPRSGPTEVRDEIVISDGHNAEDLKHITRERMAEYVGEPADTDLTFARLWELTAAKARSIANPPIATIEQDTVISTPDAQPAPKTTNHAKPKKGKGA